MSAEKRKKSTRDEFIGSDEILPVHIFWLLRLITRERLVEKLIAEIMSNPQLKYIIVCGMSGVGKSSTAEAIKNLIEKTLAFKGKKVILRTHDIARKIFLEELRAQGMSVNSIAELSIELQTEFARRLEEYFFAPCEEDEYVIIETPGFGWVKENPPPGKKVKIEQGVQRGQTVLLHLAEALIPETEKIRETLRLQIVRESKRTYERKEKLRELDNLTLQELINQGKVNFSIIYIIAQDEIRIRASEVREWVAKLPYGYDDYQLKLDFEHLGEPTELDRGSFVMIEALKWTATKDMMQAARNELNRFRDYIEVDPKVSRNSQALVETVAIQQPDEFSLDNNAWQQMASDAYTIILLRHYLKFTHILYPLFKIIFNPFAEAGIRTGAVDFSLDVPRRLLRRPRKSAD